MREFGTSIYTRPRARQRPTYARKSWLDIIRAERRNEALQAAVDNMQCSAFLYGTGIGLTHIDTAKVFGVMKPLGADFESIWDNNAEKLYEGDK